MTSVADAQRHAVPYPDRLDDRGQSTLVDVGDDEPSPARAQRARPSRGRSRWPRPSRRRRVLRARSSCVHDYRRPSAGGGAPTVERCTVHGSSNRSFLFLPCDLTAAARRASARAPPTAGRYRPAHAGRRRRRAPRPSRGYPGSSRGSTRPRGRPEARRSGTDARRPGRLASTTLARSPATTSGAATAGAATTRARGKSLSQRLDQGVARRDVVVENEDHRHRAAVYRGAERPRRPVIGCLGIRGGRR